MRHPTEDAPPSSATTPTRPLHRGAVRAASTVLLALIALCVCWEIWLAPLRPGGSWLVLKAVPLLIPLRGILHGRPYTYQWTSLLTLAYLAEGVVRASSDPGASRWYASAEIALSVALFAAIIAALRIGRRGQAAQRSATGQT